MLLNNKCVIITDDMTEEQIAILLDEADAYIDMREDASGLTPADMHKIYWMKTHKKEKETIKKVIYKAEI